MKNVPIIRISGGSVKDAISKNINIVGFFAVNNVTDNPFDFPSGYLIVFNSGLLYETTRFCIIGIPYAADKIEVKQIIIS